MGSCERVRLRITQSSTSRHLTFGLHVFWNIGASQTCSGARTVSEEAFAMLVLPKAQGFAANGIAQTLQQSSPCVNATRVGLVGGHFRDGGAIPRRTPFELKTLPFPRDQSISSHSSLSFFSFDLPPHTFCRFPTSYGLG